MSCSSIPDQEILAESCYWDLAAYGHPMFLSHKVTTEETVLELHKPTTRLCRNCAATVQTVLQLNCNCADCAATVQIVLPLCLHPRLAARRLQLCRLCCNWKMSLLAGAAREFTPAVACTRS